MNLPPLGLMLRALLPEERGTLPAAAVAPARALERAAGDGAHANPGLPPADTERIAERVPRGPSARTALPPLAADESTPPRDTIAARDPAAARSGADARTLALAGAEGSTVAGATGTPREVARPPLPPTLAAAIALSSAGRIVAEALRSGDPQRASTAPPAPRPVVAVAPLGPGSADVLAAGLRDAVEHSGVFYESHLAEWVGGQRARARLDLEPQRAWPATAGTVPDGGPAAATGTGAAGAAAPVEANRPGALPQMVQHQLDVLEARPFVWTGELWPGQPAKMTFVEDSPADRNGAPSEPATDAAPRKMRLRLELALPKLGNVIANLAVDGANLRIDLACERPGAALRLSRAAPALRAACADRALDLAGFSIDHGTAR